MKPLLLSVLVLVGCAARQPPPEFPIVVYGDILAKDQFSPSCFEFDHETTRNGIQFSCRVLWCENNDASITGGPATLWCDEAPVERTP